MDFYNKFKQFLGLPTYKNNDALQDNSEHLQDNSLDEYEKFGFNVFSNPLEMHRYFEQQMTEILRSFGMFNNDAPFFGNSDDSFFDSSKDSIFHNPFSFGFSQFPDEKEFHHNEQPEEKSLRDRFLKNGYEEPNDYIHGKADSDLDKDFNPNDLDQMLLPKSTQTPSRSHSFTFSNSMCSKMIRKPDGSVESHRTVKDQDGNQEVTITRKHGDKEYTIITRTDKNGVSEVTENFVNIDDTHKDSFLKPNIQLPILGRDLDKSFFRKLFQK